MEAVSIRDGWGGLTQGYRAAETLTAFAVARHPLEGKERRARVEEPYPALAPASSDTPC